MSPAEDQVFTDQLKDLHYRIDEKRKQDDDNQHYNDNKEEDIRKEVFYSRLKRLSSSSEVDEPTDNDSSVNSKRFKTTLTSNADEQLIKQQTITTPFLIVLDKFMDSLAKTERNLAGLPTFANEESRQTLEGLISSLQK